MELLRSLGSLIEPPGDEADRLAALLDLGPLPTRAEQTDLFLFQLYPYASVYLDTEGKMGGEARDRVAGFWRALQMVPPGDCDHLTVLLSFYSRLKELEHETEPERVPRWRHIHSAFLWEHLLSWLPVYLDRFQEVATPFYQEWAKLLGQALTELAEEIEQPAELPLHLREAPPVLDPRGNDDGDALLTALLAPVRCGMILLRDDLRRAGRELDLGVRTGERAYVLKALLSQNDSATLLWLGKEASRAADRHRRWEAITGPIASFWHSRATATAELLSDLAKDL